jgi:hypothetical protein
MAEALLEGTMTSISFMLVLGKEWEDVLERDIRARRGRRRRCRDRRGLGRGRGACDSRGEWRER